MERILRRKERESFVLTLAKKKIYIYIYIYIFTVSGAARKRLGSKKWDKNIE